MNDPSQRTTVISAGTLATLLVGGLGWFLAELHGDVKSLRDQSATISERLARIEVRQTRALDYLEWMDGESERLANVKTGGGYADNP